MFVVLYNQYNEAKDFAEKFFKTKKAHLCAIETEYGNNVLDENNSGISLSLNHHSNSFEKSFQPSLAYKHPTIQKKKFDNFIISHIDVDTIFGVAWASGIFPNNRKFIEVSNILSQIDIKGFHNVQVPLQYKKIITCIFSIVSKYKKLINLTTKICTKEVKKAILKIKDLFYDDEYLEVKYLKLKEGLAKYQITKHPLSTEKISVYTKRYFDFLINKNDFIISYTRGISIFARDEKSVLKYFDKGLDEILVEYFGVNAGGSFTSAGTSRNEYITKETFYDFVNWFKEKIEKRS